MSSCFAHPATTNADHTNYATHPPTTTQLLAGCGRGANYIYSLSQLYSDRAPLSMASPSERAKSS